MGIPGRARDDEKRVRGDEMGGGPSSGSGTAGTQGPLGRKGGVLCVIPACEPGSLSPEGGGEIANRLAAAVKDRFGLEPASR